jgi:hypothetical protein
MKVNIWTDGLINVGDKSDLTCFECLLNKTCHRRIRLAEVMHNITIEFECPDLIPKPVKDGTTPKI